MRLLIGCHYLVASGGLLRFERVGSLLRHMGHEITFAVRSPYREFRSVHPVHSFEQAAAQEWDGVLIPGAGFPDDTIRAFEVFQAPQFGLRVQMIMSDQRVLPRFRKVNAAFAPHMVIFNNEYWPSETYREFTASEFHHLIGAVDTNFYRPKVLSAQSGDRFVIGAQAAKNPEALLAALPLLPPDCDIRFFGFDRSGAITRHGGDPRVIQAGPLFGEALAAYYHGIDVMVSAEEYAGWAHVVAEAMASGTPVITTRAGTLSIAKHEDTALVIEHPTPTAIAENVKRLRQDTALRSDLSCRARAHIEAFDSRDYTRKLIEIISGFKGKRRRLQVTETG